MEDCLVSEMKELDDNQLGLFAIYDGHMGHSVAHYLQSYLFNNILREVIYRFEDVSFGNRIYHLI